MSFTGILRGYYSGDEGLGNAAGFTGLNFYAFNVIKRKKPLFERTKAFTLRFGTDLLSHPLVSGQYHRLWWA
ncbi:MAG TPA: hypothetical protein VIJ27_08140 [Mucilaginibacter sp.]